MKKVIELAKFSLVDSTYIKFVRLLKTNILWAEVYIEDLIKVVYLNKGRFVPYKLQKLSYELFILRVTEDDGEDKTVVQST